MFYITVLTYLQRGWAVGVGDRLGRDKSEPAFTYLVYLLISSYLASLFTSCGTLQRVWQYPRNPNTLLENH